MCIKFQNNFHESNSRTCVCVYGCSMCMVPGRVP